MLGAHIDPGSFGQRLHQRPHAATEGKSFGSTGGAPAQYTVYQYPSTDAALAPFPLSKTRHHGGGAGLFRIRRKRSGNEWFHGLFQYFVAKPSGNKFAYRLIGSPAGKDKWLGKQTQFAAHAPQRRSYHSPQAHGQCLQTALM